MLRSALGRLAGESQRRWQMRDDPLGESGRFLSRIFLLNGSWKKTPRVTLTRTMGRARDRDRIMRKWFVPRRVYAWEKGKVITRIAASRSHALRECTRDFVRHRRISKREIGAREKGASSDGGREKGRSLRPIHPPSLQTPSSIRSKGETCIYIYLHFYIINFLGLMSGLRVVFVSHCPLYDSSHRVV